MGIAKYIKDIGRGKDGTRALTRPQAADLFGQVLDGGVSDLEIGAFCLAMRIKGETDQEMAGFLDATHQRLHTIPQDGAGTATVVIPSYNGARKLPLLTPLLALLLAREGLPVLLHGTATESSRIFTSEVLSALEIPAHTAIKSIAPGELAFVPTGLLCPGLQRLLEVRQVVGLRNSAHSLVKLMQPCTGQNLLVSSYTHPEYALSMAATLTLVGASALLLRGTEGEAVADPRRAPRMQAFLHGQPLELQPPREDAPSAVPALPPSIDAASTAAYIRQVLAGTQPVPAPIAQQVTQVLHLARTL